MCLSGYYLIPRVRLLQTDNLINFVSMNTQLLDRNACSIGPSGERVPGVLGVSVSVLTLSSISATGRTGLVRLGTSIILTFSSVSTMRARHGN